MAQCLERGAGRDIGAIKQAGSATAYINRLAKYYEAARKELGLRPYVAR